MARRGRTDISPAKASEMLDNPPHGKALTGKQTRLFQMIKHGGHPTKVKRGAKK